MKIITKKYYINLWQINDKKQVVPKAVLKYHTDIEDGHKKFVESIKRCNSEKHSDCYCVGIRSEYVSEIDCERLFKEGSICEFESTQKEIDDLRKIMAENDIVFVNNVTPATISELESMVNETQKT